jgi:single-stranded-DNA-specific exonuclease
MFESSWHRREKTVVREFARADGQAREDASQDAARSGDAHGLLQRRDGPPDAPCSRAGVSRRRADVIIATSAFGEGVNIPDIRNVVLYHLPFGSVEFNQMAGRAGRDGAIARIHLLFGARDARINETILSSLAPERDDMAALYVVLRDIAAAEGAGFEVSNAELAQRCKSVRHQCAFDERGVSSALGILRDLGFVAGEGHGAYRRLTFTSSQQKVNLSSSVRYAEGADEIAEFQEFKAWVFSVGSNELLVRFNRPILPRG